MPERVFGHIPGYPEGSCFATRAAVAVAGLHRPPVAGIAGSGRQGATSVVIAGGYEDTQDFGDVIIYTGHGGRDPETGHQRTDQTLTRGIWPWCTTRYTLYPYASFAAHATHRPTHP